MNASARPSTSVEVPGFPDIKVCRWPSSSVVLAYYGWPEDLVAAGIITADMVEPGGKRGKKDSDGNPIDIARYWRKCDGKPRRFFRVLRKTASDRIHCLPGGPEAIAANERLKAWDNRSTDEDEESADLSADGWRERTIEHPRGAWPAPGDRQHAECFMSDGLRIVGGTDYDTKARNAQPVPRYYVVNEATRTKVGILLHTLSRALIESQEARNETESDSNADFELREAIKGLENAVYYAKATLNPDPDLME